MTIIPHTRHTRHLNLVVSVSQSSIYLHTKLFGLKCHVNFNLGRWVSQCRFRFFPPSLDLWPDNVGVRPRVYLMAVEIGTFVSVKSRKSCIFRMKICLAFNCLLLNNVSVCVCAHRLGVEVHLSWTTCTGAQKRGRWPPTWPSFSS